MAAKISHRGVLAALALAAGVGAARAQDVGFSLPYAAPLYLNPAYSGVPDFSRAGAGYRYQWGQLGDPYTTYAFFADHYFDDFKSGVGLSAVSDRQAGGAVVQSSVGASYAYNLRLAEKTFLRFGLQAQLGATSVGAARLIFTDMLSPEGGVSSSEPYAAEQRTYFDMALGSVFSHDLFFAGVALHHLMGSPEVEVLGQPLAVPRKLTLHAGYNIPLGQRSAYSYYNEEERTTTLSPNVIFCWQGVYASYSAGAYLNVKSFSLGLFYRSALKSSANFFSLSVGYTGPLFGLAYSFDAGKISREAKAYMPSTHEVSLIFKVKKRQRDSFGRQWERPYRVQNTPTL